MKITKKQLRKIVQEAILKEEPSDYYRDYRAGSISYEEYQQMVRDYERRTGGGSSGRSSYRRKTSYVGADANADKIGAIEAALAKKPNNFLQSILDQLKSGRGLSGKQKGIVRKILKKTDPSAVALFESVLIEGNHAVDYALGYEDARDGFPQENNDPWYVAGYEDYFAGVHDQYAALHQDGITNPPAKSGPMLDEGKLRKKIRKLVRKEMYHPMNEGVLYVTRGPYGMSVSANDPDPHGGDGEPILVGEMVLALLEAGDDDIFQAPQGVDPQALANLKQKHEEGVQGGMQRWDSDVFEQYYSVDNDRVVRLYAKLMNHSIEEVPYDEY